MDDNQMPFCGVYLAGDGTLKDLLGNPATDVPNGMVPLNSEFYAADGAIHNLDEVIARFSGGGGGGLQITPLGFSLSTDFSQYYDVLTNHSYKYGDMVELYLVLQDKSVSALKYDGVVIGTFSGATLQANRYVWNLTEGDYHRLAGNNLVVDGQWVVRQNSTPIIHMCYVDRNHA